MTSIKNSSNSNSSNTSEVDLSQFELCDNKQLDKNEEEIQETSLSNNLFSSPKSPEINITDTANVIEALFEASLDTEQTESKIDKDSESSEKDENEPIKVYSEKEYFQNFLVTCNLYIFLKCF